MPEGSPTPWGVAGPLPDGKRLVIRAADGTIVAEVFGLTEWHIDDRSRADARRIVEAVNAASEIGKIAEIPAVIEDELSEIRRRLQVLEGTRAPDESDDDEDAEIDDATTPSPSVTCPNCGGALFLFAGSHPCWRCLECGNAEAVGIAAAKVEPEPPLDDGDTGIGDPLPEGWIRLKNGNLKHRDGCCVGRGADPPLAFVIWLPPESHVALDVHGSVRRFRSERQALDAAYEILAKRAEPAKVEPMPSEPSAELARLRELEAMVRRILEQTGDDHCWMDWGRLYPEMARLCGMPDWTPKILPPAAMFQNCEHFIDCMRRGRHYESPVVTVVEAASMRRRIAELESAKAEPPIDPALPRRFRWPYADGSGEWSYGAYWPANDRWSREGVSFGSGRPDKPRNWLKGLEWIDPEPAEVKP